MLPAKAITEYKKLYRERFGVDPTDNEAREQAEKLVQFYRAQYDLFEATENNERND